MVILQIIAVMLTIFASIATIFRGSEPRPSPHYYPLPPFHVPHPHPRPHHPHLIRDGHEVNPDGSQLYQAIGPDREADDAKLDYQRFDQHGERELNHSAGL